MKRTRKPNWLLVGLVTGMIVLALAGLGLLGAYFYLSRQTSAEAPWVNPVDAIRPNAVAPDLAVLTLAGEPDDRVIRVALDAGEIETAFATLAYSVLLPDAVRSGHWLLLAARYIERDPTRAALCSTAALDHAALAPTLGDIGRADLALQAARGFAMLKKPDLARPALAEVESIARYSVTLMPAQRHDSLARALAIYQMLGDSRAAATLRAELEAVGAGPGVRIEQPAPLLPALRGSIVLSGTVASAIVAREQAAADMAGRWLSEPGEHDALASALGQALMAEDASRAELYAQADTFTPENRLALLHDQVAWLTVKYRVARGAYGVPLVPEWQAEEVRAKLADAYTDLINGYGRQLDTLSASDTLVARVELLRQGMLWVRLGLFPDHAEQTLSEQLFEASTALWTRQGGVGLVVQAKQAGGEHLYLLVGGEEAAKK